MKTTLDLVDITWKHINASPLKEAISGGVYKFKRPTNSEAEDVVINSLPITNGQLQQAVVNVNVFVPNKVQSIGGYQDDEQPDTKRLKLLAELATSDLVDVWEPEDSYGVNYDVQQQTVIQDDDSKQYYINIRLQFYSVNI